tara:strand:+ start:276 stop:842 length:567 start_codon:yes stop_codon:yes gene_type:complete
MSNVESSVTGKKKMTSGQLNATRISNRLTDEILEAHWELLDAIVSRRTQGDRLDDIALAETESLERIGAETHAIRVSIISKVCSASLPEEISRDVRSKNHAQVARGFSPSEAEKSISSRQVYPWTPEIDAKILELMSSIFRGVTRQNDWKQISQIMEMNCGMSICPKMLCNRGMYLKRKSFADNKEYN